MTRRGRLRWFAALSVSILVFGPGVAALGQQKRATEAKPQTKPKRGGPKKFFVIAPEAFHPALAEYIEYKRSVRPTTLVSLEKVLKSTEGFDDPERLKRFLYEAWRKQHLGYVLLVGDVDVMPVRYMVLDRVTPAAFDYAFYPSDLYYADLARRDGSFDDWNAVKQGFHRHYFGEVHGEKNKKGPINFDEVSYHPEIAFGRWPVSTEKEVRVVAAKTIAYEKSVREGTHAGLRRVDFFNTAGYVDVRDKMTAWSRELPAGWTAGRYFYTDDKKPYHTPAPDEVHVIEAANAGCGLIAHVGHGSDNSWYKSISTRGLGKLKDADRLPVMISVGCSTANFAPLPPYSAYVDSEGQEHAGTNNKEVFRAPPPPPSPYQKGKYNPTGLGEQMLKRGETGAVVYIGCNTGAQPCAITLLEGFLAAMRKPEPPLVGDCWVSAIHYYYDHEKLAKLTPNKDWYPPSIFFQGMKFMFFGDPTVPFARSPASQAKLEP
jgi:Peptidase family C25